MTKSYQRNKPNRKEKIFKDLKTPPAKAKIGVFWLKHPTAWPDTRQKGLTPGLILLRLQNMGAQENS